VRRRYVLTSRFWFQDSYWVWLRRPSNSTPPKAPEASDRNGCLIDPAASSMFLEDRRARIAGASKSQPLNDGFVTADR